jgi:hypothetical protein
VTYIDAFNGDADGICALHQLRLATPIESILITGVKRDISLLQKVEAGSGDELTVLDISLDKNRVALQRLLEDGVQIRYFDHHYAGDIPDNAGLKATIDSSPDTCTSLLVDQHLNGKYRDWAVVGAFGDNLDTSARQAAEQLEINEKQLMQFRELGIYINYNAYGTNIKDLHYPPQQLFQLIHPFEKPLDFIFESDTFNRLKEGYSQDMSKTEALAPEMESEKCALYILPDAAWARRVSGVLGNKMAQNSPQRAHALLTTLPDGGYVVSVRAPLVNKTGADELCRAFPTGGGRKAAAGINHLPDSLFNEFSAKFKEVFS